MSERAPDVEEVLRFEDLPLGALASRRAIVRWSDGTEGECARWYRDEVLIPKAIWSARRASRSGPLHFRRDRDWLRS